MTVANERMAVANECTRAYQATRSCLRDYELPPGSEIPVRFIADSLGMSVTPVHKACCRLAAEGWAIPDNKDAYFAWRPEENVIVGLYDCNRAILSSALDHAVFANTDENREQAAIRKLREILSRRDLTDAALAANTGALFFAIVARSGKQDVIELVRVANERLYYLRILECRRFGDTASELIAHCELFLRGRREDLQQAIVRYHERRRNLVPELCGLLAAQ